MERVETSQGFALPSKFKNLRNEIVQPIKSSKLEKLIFGSEHPTELI